MKNTKFIHIVFVALLSLAFMYGCSDDEKFPTHPEPTWQVVHDDYSVNMTAVVKLPDYLTQYADKGDMLAAFSSDICRGLGEIIDGVYYVTIKGNSDEEGSIHFQFYSGRNNYLYKTTNLFSFEKDRVYGTADEPMELPLEVVK